MTRTGHSGSHGPRAASGPTRVLDIRAKLFLAFGALAGLTLLACIIAWIVFWTIDRSVTRVTQERVPTMVDALALAKTVADLSALAPAIMSSGSHDELAAEKSNLEASIQRFTDLSASLDRAGHAGNGESTLGELADALVLQLGELRTSVDRRLHLKRLREAKAAAIQQAHAQFSETLEPMIDDAVFELVITGESVMGDNTTSVTRLVEEGVSDIDQLLTINAAANLAAGLLAEAINIDDPVVLEPIRERFVSAAGAIERSLALLSDGMDKAALQRACDRLLALGQASPNVFDLRAALLRDGQDRSDDLAAANTALRTGHEELLLELTPMIDDAAFSLVMTTENVTSTNEEAISGLIEGGVNTLTLLLNVRAEGNLVASILSESAVAANESLLLPLSERFAASEARLKTLLSQVREQTTRSDIGAAAQALLALGLDATGTFELRRAELSEAASGQQALDASRRISRQLGEAVAGIVTTAEAESLVASQSSSSAIETGQVVMLILTVLSIGGAMLVMFRFVDPRIIRPIGNITTAMSDLAGGNTSVDIPSRDRHDELGRMAQALGVFRDNAIAVQEANLKEIQATRQRLADAIESISEGFSLYDSDDVLVVSNRRYQQLLYPDMSDPIESGSTFESIIRRTVAEGHVRDAIGREEAWIAERMAHHHNPGQPHVQQRGDGRYVMVSERRTDDGGTVAVYSDITELKQRETELAKKSTELEQLAGQLAKYLSPQVYESIFTGRQEVKVASQRKKLTVFFSDIADFTETTEKLESEDLTLLLNQYLTEMSKIALSYGATIDKYVGDAIVIFFGDPETRGVQQDALACVEMAIAMRRRLQELRSLWRDSGIEKPLQCRIGINTGYCTVGNFGSEARMDYTIIGAGVNLASRLESSAAPGDILISYETYAWVKDAILCEAREPIRVKGISRPVATYRVIDIADGTDRQTGPVREEYPNLRLDMNPAAMTQEEREKAEEALLQALRRLGSQSSAKKPASR